MAKKKKNAPEAAAPPTPELETGVEMEGAQNPDPDPIQTRQAETQIGQVETQTAQVETQPGQVEGQMEQAGAQVPEFQGKIQEKRRTPPPRLSQNELIARAAADARISSSTAAVFFASLKKVIVESLKDRLVVMLGPDLGNLRLIDTKERQSRNPRTGETVMVPAGVRPRFTPGPLLKTYLKTGEWPERQPRRRPAGDFGDDSPAEAGFKSRRAEKIARRKAEKRAEGQTPPPPQPMAPPSGEVVEEQDIDAILKELE